MSIIISQKIFISAVEKNPAIISPKVYISAIEKSPAVLTTKVFISAVPKNPAVVSPKVFVSVIDSREKAVADTLRQIKNNSITEKVVADTCRCMLDRATVDTSRKVTRPEKVSADTVIRHPHILNFLAQDSIVNSFKDYQATRFEISLNERTLSDSFTLETARQININDAVQGTFLDYPYSFLVEETTQQELLSSVKGMYDIDKLLYSFIETDLHDETEIYLDGVRYYGASSYVSKIAGYLGLTPNIKIEDFTPYNVVGNTNITYSDLISSLFSWTSRLPQRQINVFIRGKTLHCIQRGLENSVFDISDIPHSRPTFNKKLIRSMYNSPFDDNDDYGNDEEAADRPYSGTIAYSDLYSYNRLVYRNGLLVSEYSRTANNKIEESITQSNYNYKNLGTDEAQYYLTSKTTKNTTTTNLDVEAVGKYGVSDYNSDKNRITTEVKTDYIYSITTERDIDENNKGNLKYVSKRQIYLYKEYEINTKTESTKSKNSLKWKLLSKEGNERQTTHSPLGNGWYGTTVYENGEHKGSSISQGAPSNQVSQYTTKAIQRAFGVQSTDPKEIYEQHRSKLAPIADTSFPVRELDLLEKLTDDLKWLNRKVQETVTVDLISRIENGVPELKHIVDFTERVKLDGSEYFLVSNNITCTPRKLIQKLQLVRWTD